MHILSFVNRNGRQGKGSADDNLEILEIVPVRISRAPGMEVQGRISSVKKVYNPSSSSMHLYFSDIIG